jgi:hypothetical protein
MMHHEAGVRVVTVGGRPTTGPMQAVGGTRGARSFSTDILDNNINFARQLLEDTSDADFLPNRTEALDVFIVGGAVNLRDQVRQGETTPLQFAYEAADCRIFFTPQTIFNYTALWQYAADAIWTNPGLCVAGSTGYATSSKTDSSDVPVQSPPVSNASAFNIADHVTIDPNRNNSTIEDVVGELAGDLLAGPDTRASIQFLDCTQLLSPSFVCIKVQRCTGDAFLLDTAVPICRALSTGSSCVTNTGPGTCVIDTTMAEFFLPNPPVPVFTGFCQPFPARCNAGRIAGLTQVNGLTTTTQVTPNQGVRVGGGPINRFSSGVRRPRAVPAPRG